MNWRGSFLLGSILILGTLLSAQVQELGAPIINNYEPEQYKAHAKTGWRCRIAAASCISEIPMVYWNSTASVGNSSQRRGTPSPGPWRPDLMERSTTAPMATLDTWPCRPPARSLRSHLKGAIPRNERAFNDVWQVESSADGIYFLTRSRIFRFHGGRITALPGKFASSQACLLNETVFYADMDKGLCMLAGDQVVPIPQLAGLF